MIVIGGVIILTTCNMYFLARQEMFIVVKNDCVIFPSLFKEGTLDSVAQHGIQPGWLPRVAADK